MLHMQNHPPMVITVWKQPGMQAQANLSPSRRGSGGDGSSHNPASKHLADSYMHTNRIIPKKRAPLKYRKPTKTQTPRYADLPVYHMLCNGRDGPMHPPEKPTMLRLLECLALVLRVHAGWRLLAARLAVWWHRPRIHGVRRRRPHWP